LQTWHSTGLPLQPKWGKVDELSGLGQKSGLNFEQSMRLGLEAVLVLPHFIYRLERDPNPHDASAVHAVSDYEPVSRLSYSYGAARLTRNF
jgi:hypothetical protein